MAKNPAAKPPADKLELYEKLVATRPEVERRGATMPYTMGWVRQVLTDRNARRT
jgi:hypothetical protein